MTSAVVSGFLLGLGLIVAIGAQNAFVLRQGLLREHVFAVTTLCALSDALLISAGVLGLGTLIRQSPMLITIATWGGAAFLLFYAGLALRRALFPHALKARGEGAGSLKAALAAAFLFTWANPHVYLDTVVLFGGVSARLDGADRTAFWIGGSLASAVWFYGLGYGARLLAPVFARPVAWRVLDLVIAAIMTAIAASLIFNPPG